MINRLELSKPRLKPFKDGFWYCSDTDLFIGSFGPSPESAYRSWLEKMKTFTKLPRANWRNKKSVLAWVREGCPRIRSYYLDMKLLVGYDAKTDELILQG